MTFFIHTVLSLADAREEAVAVQELVLRMLEYVGFQVLKAKSKLLPGQLDCCSSPGAVHRAANWNACFRLYETQYSYLLTFCHPGKLYALPPALIM